MKVQTQLVQQLSTRITKDSHGFQVKWFQLH